MRTVYCFDFYEPRTGQLVHSPRAAIIDRIERMDGIPLRDTGLEVDEDEVDSNGFLRGKANCGHASHEPQTRILGDRLGKKRMES